MADIFISYARSTAPQAQQIAQALRALGYDVWRDDELPAHRSYAEVIEERLKAAKAVVVIWSAEAVKSEWVQSEADRARNDRKLVQLSVNGTALPMPFDRIQCADLSGWTGEVASPGWRKVVSSIAELISSAASASKSSTAGPAANADDENSIAVLPFVNMSSDPEQEYFSDGLSEELLNQLAQLKELRVIGRTSCFAFKGKNEDLRTIGQKLGAAHILEGSVRKAGKRLRITAQLIKCADHYHLWSQTYDRELDDVFAIQEDVAKAVASALGIALGIGKTTELPGGTRNVEAYDLYLRALALSNASLGSMSLDRATALFRRAVALDPDFAAAWTQLAGTIAVALIFEPEATKSLRLERDRALERAIALAPELWAGHAARAEQFLARRDWLAADLAFARASELGPHPFPGAVNYMSMRCAVGRVKDSIPYYYAIRQADPLLPLATLQITLVIAERYAEADAEYARTKEMASGPVGLADWFAFAQAMATEDRASVKRQYADMIAGTGAGNAVFNPELLAVFDDSAAAIEWLRRRAADFSPAVQGVLVLFAFMAAHFGAADFALLLLRRVFVERNASPIMNVWHPVFAPVRKLAGFKDLVRDLGIADYWRKSGQWGDFARPVGDDNFEIIR